MIKVLLDTFGRKQGISILRKNIAIQRTILSFGVARAEKSWDMYIVPSKV
jgi:hypothetical protein